MILYFSATGNNEYIAGKIAEATGDRAVSMTTIPEPITLTDGEALGFVLPTYFWGLPSYVEEFLGQITIHNAQNAYIYLVATYGSTAGQIDGDLKRLLKKQGLTLSASFGIKTVDNWTVWYSVKGADISAVLQSEAEQTDGVIAAIKAKQRVFIQKHKKSRMMCVGARMMYKSYRKTSHFEVEDGCIHCGLCERDCPVGAIKLTDGIPTWVAERCTLCLRCLHRCPAFAIQYAGKTKENGQYIHPQD